MQILQQHPRSQIVDETRSSVATNESPTVVIVANNNMNMYALFQFDIKVFIVY